jgi:hypothetical protein
MRIVPLTLPERMAMGGSSSGAGALSTLGVRRARPRGCEDIVVGGDCVGATAWSSAIARGTSCTSSVTCAFCTMSSSGTGAAPCDSRSSASLTLTFISALVGPGCLPASDQLSFAIARSRLCWPRRRVPVASTVAE